MGAMKAMLLVGVGLLAVAGCGDDANDNHNGTGGTSGQSSDPSREERIQSIAVAACARYADAEAGCPGYGTSSDQPYQTQADCLRDFEDKAGDLWPANECGNGRINDAKYRTCEDRAKVVACSQSLWDAIGALDECKADSVCTDPPAI